MSATCLGPLMRVGARAADGGLVRKGRSRLFACGRRFHAQREAPGYPESFRDAGGRIAVAAVIDIRPFLVESVELAGRWMWVGDADVERKAKHQVARYQRDMSWQ